MFIYIYIYRERERNIIINGVWGFGAQGKPTSELGGGLGLFWTICEIVASIDNPEPHLDGRAFAEQVLEVRNPVRNLFSLISKTFQTHVCI